MALANGVYMLNADGYRTIAAAANNVVQVQEPKGEIQQKWMIEKQPEGFYFIKNIAYGKYLMPKAAKIGADIVLGDFGYGWFFERLQEPSKNVFYYIRSLVPAGMLVVGFAYQGATLQTYQGGGARLHDKLFYVISAPISEKV